MIIKTAKPLIFLFTVLALASLACSVDLYGTPTPAPPAIEQSILSEQTTATDQPAVNVQQFYIEEFDTEDNNWEYIIGNTQPVKGGTGSKSLRTAGGLLVFDLKSQNTSAQATYTPFTYADVRLDVKAGNRGTNNNKVSLICRKSDAGWYQFDIANNGLYEIFFARPVGDAVEYARIADGGSNAIKTGLAENEYGIVCQGNTLILNINGTEARRLEDKKYLLPEGQVGVAVFSLKDTPVTIDFYWARISQP